MRTVFFDIDTQIDFLYPAGALHVPGAEEIVPLVARLNRYAAAQRSPLISTVDTHAEDDEEFRVWPPHCVAGTAGQRKAAVTLLDGWLPLPAVPGEHLVDAAPQIVVEKRSLDPLDNPNLSALLGRAAADRYLVYGVVTEICVRRAALGLLRTGKPVEVVADAIRSIDETAAARFFEEFAAAGGRFTTVAQVCSA